MADRVTKVTLTAQVAQYVQAMEKAAKATSETLSNGFVGLGYQRMRELGLPSDSGKCAVERVAYGWCAN